MKAHRGTFTVLITPFRDGTEKVDEERLRQLVEYQINEGIHGLIPTRLDRRVPVAHRG